MKLFNRNKHEPQPPAEQTVKPVHADEMQYCAFCSTEGAKHVIRGGDWYLGQIKYYLCDACLEDRARFAVEHVNRQRKIPLNTVGRMQAVNLALEKQKSQVRGA